MNFTATIEEHLTDHLATVERLRAFTPLIEDLAKRIVASIETGGKVLFFGNGGSAADAQHLAAEFVVRYRQNRRALPAIALTTDTSILTAGANDFGYESIFARQVEALANQGDVVIGITTSGSSANVVNGLQAAKDKGCIVVAFVGEKGGKATELSDLAFLAPSIITARVQECHMLAGHIVCELVESAFLEK